MQLLRGAAASAIVSRPGRLSQAAELERRFQKPFLRRGAIQDQAMARGFAKPGFGCISIFSTQPTKLLSRSNRPQVVTGTDSCIVAREISPMPVTGFAVPANYHSSIHLEPRQLSCLRVKPHSHRSHASPGDRPGTRNGSSIFAKLAPRTAWPWTMSADNFSAWNGIICSVTVMLRP